MSTDLPTQCETLVIGAGVVGLSIAYELARRGNSVVVVDRQPPGLEASWAGAGILPPGSWYEDHPALEQLAALAGKLNPEWSTELRATTGIDNELATVGALHLVASPEHAERLAAKFDRWRALYISITKPHSITEIEPQLRFDAAKSCYYVPGEAQINNRRHVEALVAGCGLRGVSIAHPAEVEQLVRQGSAIAAVETSAGTVKANRIVLAAGSWSEMLGHTAEIPLKIRPIRGQMLSFGPRTEPLLRGIVHRGDRYLVSRRDGRLIVGSTVEDVGFEKRNTPEAMSELEQFARDLLPALADEPVLERWSGLRPASGDGLPYIGPVPGVHNAYVAAGHYRAGLQLASGTAVALVDLMMGEAPPLDLSPFRLDR
ncbi:glycine oxidase ThiO [Aeoliella sp. SH292]|uniref:glycine oxidase ThiO n=1 Tax=Aeoliella sp. SH292 TaxID=3454464 RepID=UPI003F9A3DA2